jgi:hypothetical protein
MIFSSGSQLIGAYAVAVGALGELDVHVPSEDTELQGDAGDGRLGNREDLPFGLVALSPQPIYQRVPAKGRRGEFGLPG